MEYEVRALGSGKVISVLVEALNEEDAQGQVAARACRPLSVRRHGRGLARPRGERRLSFSLILFSQELLALLEAGLSIVEALDALREKERHPPVRHVFARLLHSLQEGKSFSRALEELPAIFPPLYVGIVRAAERTSGLGQALGRYVDYQARLDAVKAKVLSACIYPAILLLAGVLVSLFLLGYVVPRFANIYQGTGQHLPWLSALLLGWGELVSRHPLPLVAGSLGALAASLALLRQLWRQGGLLRGLQRLPLLAEQIRTFQFARLYLTLGMLLDGGLPIVPGLALAGELLSPELRARLQAASRAIQGGASISQAFERHGLSTPVGLRLLRVGERSGKMGEMMGRAARLYDTEVSRAIEWFSRIFEPLLMTAIGLVIGGIVVLLYLPIFDLAGSIQ